MDEKKTIMLMNKGKRPWDLVDASGAKKHIETMGTIELDETKALRMLLDYPRDFIKASEAGTSSKDIARMEQSLRDRSANLDAREKALDEREAALDAREKALETNEKAPTANEMDENGKVPGKTETTIAGNPLGTRDAPAKKAGRPPKADKAEAEK